MYIVFQITHFITGIFDLYNIKYHIKKNASNDLEVKFLRNKQINLYDWHILKSNVKGSNKITK